MSSSKFGRELTIYAMEILLGLKGLSYLGKHKTENFFLNSNAKD